MKERDFHGRGEIIMRWGVLMGCSRSRAARFRAAQFRAAQYRAERFSAAAGCLPAGEFNV